MKRGEFLYLRLPVGQAALAFSTQLITHFPLQKTMKILFRPLLAVGLFMVATLPAQSQGTPAPLETRQAYELPVKNVPAHLMAWWLDPTHQPHPAELGPPLSREAEYFPAPFALPASIEKITADDAQKKLLVWGDEKDVQKLRELVTTLDQPLRALEIETRIVGLTQRDQKTLNLDFGTLPSSKPEDQIRPTISLLAIGSSPSMLLATPGLSTPPIGFPAPGITTTSIINNGNGKVEFSRNYAVLLPLQADEITRTAKMQAKLEIELTPTINNDDTITIGAHIEGKSQLLPEDATKDPALVTPFALETIFNVKDGQTIALRLPDQNFTSNFLAPSTLLKVPFYAGLPQRGDFPIGQLFRSRNGLSGSQTDALVLFFTPHIVQPMKP
ncbi:hypothetical protein IAD21_04540 [Abditibacteriota bacterium]|nr:hypothetical protein IAD21_04540 [Abditibacteriota bacterium]